MLAPTNRTITIPAGGKAYVGKAAPPTVVPAWAVNAPLNAWMAIPGTAGAGGTDIEGFSGWAKLPNGKIAIALAGGHTDGVRNSVAVIDMLMNAPSWVEVCPPSPTHTYEVAYEEDGKPTSCHTYQTLAWVPTTNRLMRFGAVGVSLSGNTNFPNVDGYNLATNTWDPQGTWTPMSIGSSGAAYDPVAKKELLIGGSKYYDPVTGAMSNVSLGNVNTPRNPWVHDSLRGHMFGMSYGDNQRASIFLGVVAAKVVNNVATQITLTGDSALALLTAEVPEYAGMDYDPVNDCYYWYNGKNDRDAAAPGRVYKIKPNNTNSWPITVHTLGAGGVTPVPTVNSGLNNKFAYIPELNGIVMMATKAANLYFMRTS